MSVERSATCDMADVKAPANAPAGEPIPVRKWLRPGRVGAVWHAIADVAVQVDVPGVEADGVLAHEAPHGRVVVALPVLVQPGLRIVFPTRVHEAWQVRLARLRI